MIDKSFKSKILLFGEYSIIHNSMGLSIPFDFFKGSLTFKSKNFTPEQVAQSNKDLKQFAAFLKTLNEREDSLVQFDIEALNKDIEKGLIFDSTIPQGFGVGSSGALVAAVYDKYAFDKIFADECTDKNKILQLKKIFSQIESYFHGTSSGMDPLICYVQHPVLIENKDAIGTVGLPLSNAEGSGAIFLINTGSPGKTQPLVNLFLEKCKQDGFLHLLRSELIPFNDNCIKAFLKGEVNELFTNVKELSKFLLSYLSPMIPRKFRKVWKQGIESHSYYLKLCGSGGGGFLLGFTEDIEKAKSDLKEFEIEVIHRF
jgi:mevalonate kinase